MTKLKGMRIAIGFCGALIATIPHAAVAAVRYVGSGNDTSTVFSFDFTLPTFAPSGATAVNGTDGSCSSSTFGAPSPCGGLFFFGDGQFIGFPGGVFDFGTGSTTSFGSYSGSFNGAPGATLSVSPGAPAPLLGLGLLPAFAAAGGLVVTRRRRKAAAA